MVLVPTLRPLAYMARSQITGGSDSTEVEISLSGTTSLAFKVKRELAAMGKDRKTVEASGLMKVKETTAWVSLGFCTSTYSSNPHAVVPSARYQLGLGGGGPVVAG